MILNKNKVNLLLVWMGVTTTVIQNTRYHSSFLKWMSEN